MKTFSWQGSSLAAAWSPDGGPIPPTAVHSPRVRNAAGSGVALGLEGEAGGEREIHGGLAGRGADDPPLGLGRAGRGTRDTPLSAPGPAQGTG